MAFRFVLVLLRLAASDVAERRVQDLPRGFEFNETMNGWIPLTIIPSWDVFLGFSDKQKYIKGRMTIGTVYPEVATTFVEKPEDMVDVQNFGSGSGDITTMSSLKLWNPKVGKSTSISKTYVGEFSQSLYPYDLSCYPFDRKTMMFIISLQKPCGAFYRLALGCVGEGSVTESVDDDGNVLQCSWPINASSVGFDWEMFTCALNGNSTLECQMSGTRQSEALLKIYLWPSIIYGLMGFQAFALGVKLAMPRVATTMLALLSLTNLRNQVMNTLPSSGATSWLEEYFLLSISFMLLNLMGHAASFHLDATGRHHTQKMVNKFNLWGVLSLFVLIVIARLHVRECTVIDPWVSLTTLLLTATATVSIILFLVWYHRSAFREFGRQLGLEAEELAKGLHHGTSSAV
ncbi:unnamed protein product [Effrenium voratum]|uniref:Uncharacterized protein n=1 Tax=Effrenium voratum TaxID=2562239 RepID=A0AA36HVW8_9DINO|nr:unnamed protein product [Effrenium voratum]